MRRRPRWAPRSTSRGPSASDPSGGPGCDDPRIGGGDRPGRTPSSGGGARGAGGGLEEDRGGRRAPLGIRASNRSAANLTAVLPFSAGQAPQWAFRYPGKAKSLAVGNREMPLAADWTAPSAFYWFMSDLDDLRPRQGFPAEPLHRGKRGSMSRRPTIRSASR